MTQNISCADSHLGPALSFLPQARYKYFVNKPTQQTEEKPKVIAIVGPTASGKSALGLFLAQKLHGEIVSADSRQIYHGMGIISRAPSKQELAAVPHHLVGMANPRSVYSAGAYIKQAAKILKKMETAHTVPIVVGGAGFYADALLRDGPLPQVAPNKKLRAALAKKSPVQLLAMLQKIDPKSAKRVDPHNIVRLVRTIEVASALGSVPERGVQQTYEVLWLGLRPDENKHERTIRKGVMERLKRGMVVEVKKLRATLPKKRFGEFGFEFALVADYLDKKITKTELMEALVRGEQKYAVRQMRWFKRFEDITWLTNKKEALALAMEFLT